MSSAVAEKKPFNKAKEKKAAKRQNSKQAREKVSRSKPFPWKLVFGAVAIIGVMALLSNPINPNSIKNESSAKTSRSSLNGFSLEK